MAAWASRAREPGDVDADDRQGDGDRRRPVVVDFQGPPRRHGGVADGRAGTSNDDIKYARDAAPKFDDDATPAGASPMNTSSPGSRHTLSVLVENKPGVLARIAGLFSPPRLNIDSLAVGPDRAPRSRMTIVVNVEDSPARAGHQAAEQAGRVIKIVELDGSASVNRELLLVKVRADADTRSQVPTPSSSSGQGRRRLPDAVTIQAVSNSDKLADLLRVLGPSASASSSSPAWSRSVAAPASERTLRPVTVPARPLRAEPTTRTREASVAEMFYDDDADLSPIQGKNVGGHRFYGSQGTPRAALRRPGVDPRVGLQPTPSPKADAGRGSRRSSRGGGGGRRHRHPRPDQHQRKLRRGDHPA